MYSFSQAAAMDVENILERSLKDFGLTQTEQYFISLKKCLELLCANPGIGYPKPALFRLGFEFRDLFSLVHKWFSNAGF